MAKQCSNHASSHALHSGYTPARLSLCSPTHCLHMPSVPPMFGLRCSDHVADFLKPTGRQQTHSRVNENAKQYSCSYGMRSPVDSLQSNCYYALWHTASVLFMSFQFWDYDALTMLPPFWSRMAGTAHKCSWGCELTVALKAWPPSLMAILLTSTWGGIPSFISPHPPMGANKWHN